LILIYEHADIIGYGVVVVVPTLLTSDGLRRTFDDYIYGVVELLFDGGVVGDLLLRC